MKAKNLFFIFILLMLFLSFPGSVLAADENADGYDDNDFNKIQTFLNQISNDGVKTNGEHINAAYDANDPSTWAGIIWSADTHKRVVEIVWINKDLAGNLDLSDLTFLTRLLCIGNSIKSINLSGAVNLEDINLSNNELTSLEIDSNPSQLICSGNKLGKLDLSGKSDLQLILCNYNNLTELDINGCVNLTNLDCSDNNLSGTFDVSKAVKLTTLYCFNNQLSGLKLSENRFDRLITSNNKIKNISTDMFVKDQTFTVNGDGYIFLNMNSLQNHISLNAETDSESDSVFCYWSYEGVETSTSPVHYLDYSQPMTVNITADFKPALTTVPSDGVIYTGGRVTATPLFKGGQWQYDSSYLKADFTNPNKPVFTALKGGTTQISYTFYPGYVYETSPDVFNKASISDNGVLYTVTLDITIKTPLLPITGQNFTLAVILASIAAVMTSISIVMKKNARKNQI